MRFARYVLVPLALAFAATSFAHASAPDDASALFEHAKTEAASEHKNVLLVFSASWCGPCHLYEHYLDDPKMKAIIDRAFVVQRIDVGEHKGDPAHIDTPGGVALRSSLGAGKEPGFPWLVVTTPDGKPLINSYANGNSSKNVGYPVAPEEIDWYMDMLKKTAPQLNEGDLAATRKWLEAMARQIG